MTLEEAQRIRRLASEYAQASYEEGVELGVNGTGGPAWKQTRQRTLDLAERLESALRVMSA